MLNNIQKEQSLFSTQDPVGISMETAQVINYAAAQNNIPVILKLILENKSTQALQNIELHLSSNPAFFEPKRFLFEILHPSELRTLSSTHLNIELNHEYLQKLDESELSAISVRVTQNDNELASFSKPIRILAHNEWGAKLGLPELLTAHVQPTTLEVDRILAKASQLLKESKNLSLNGYQSKNREYVWMQANAIYQTLMYMGLQYAPPPASFEETGQKIRTTSQVVSGGLMTCLDSSVLFAACLEQAGLNPVILLKKGHAWVGVWLVDSYFTNSVEDCAQDVRKRIDSGELLTFETTGISSKASMRKTIADAKFYLDESEENYFEYLVDIKRARQNHIRPMKSSTVNTSEMNVEVNQLETKPLLEDVPELPSLDPSVISPETIDIVNTPEGRIENWKSKLLDLSLRNKLLNFKPSKKYLRVITHSVADLEDALASGNEFKLVVKRSLSDSGDPRSEEEFKAEYGMTSAEQHAQSVLKNNEICIDIEKDKLQSHTSVIYRESKNAIAETGSNTLFLALGTLYWKEAPEAESILKAPILLVPVKLKRGSVGSGVRLERLDEETIFNPTLMQKLAITFEIQLPFLDGNLPTDEAGVDVDKIFAILRKKIEDLKGFEVKKEVYLGLYSFTKYLMWQDLAKRSQDLFKNKVVDHLINHHGENFDDGVATVRPEELDENYSPQTLFTPLMADSSQLAVICSAERGKNMVVEGPPGTGKSQTIVNLIAHFIAKGKTVLFVAEKMAALEVVHKRLADIGLDEFCLELHSTKAKKSEISKQFVQVLGSYDKHSVSDWDMEAQRLAALRNELNSFVSILHKRHKSGLSVYEAMGLSLLLKQKEAIQFPWSDSNRHSKQEKIMLEDFVGDLASHLTRLSKVSGNPLEGIKNTAYTPSWKDSLLQAMQEFSDLAIKVKNNLQDLSSSIRININTISLEQLKSIDELSTALLTASQVPLEAFEQVFNSLQRKKLAELIRHGRIRATHWDFFKGYAFELKSLRADTLKFQWTSAQQCWWLKRWLSKRKVTNQIRFYNLKKKRLGDQQVEKFLTNLANLNNEDDYLVEHSSFGIEVLGELFKLENTDWDKAASHQRWMDEFAQSVQKSFQSETEMMELNRKKLKEQLLDESDAFVPGGRLYTLSQAYRETYSNFALSLKKLKELTGNQDFLGGPNNIGVLSKIEILNQEWKAHQKEVQPWCIWNDFKKRANTQGLQGLIAQIKAGYIGLDELKEHFVISYADWWLKRILDKEPLLANFSGATQSHKIEEFKKADERFQELTVQYVKAKLRGQIPTELELVGDLKKEVGYLKKEAQKQRAHRPIREVLAESSTIYPRIKPCLLMSPQSVAQYLDTTSQTFDLVIFDEASQITTWDAVGAIARGKQLICVGDPKQLPPTNFFNATDDSGDFDDGTLVEMESILDECLTIMPLLRLSWHYRSRNEGLITFSNYQYYDSSLITFPSPVEVDNSVEFINSMGVYEPGKSRTNRIEAEKIVDEIERHYLSGDSTRFSLGVITFNSTQQALIENLLDQRRIANSKLDETIATSDSEELFIKNLENVQGDERDIILFSITFAKDASGKLSMNFGPINKEGGHRRLNVAATRARFKVKVFSSLRPEDIDLSRTKARGVADLKAYLDFALNGTRALIEHSLPTGREPDSPFEQQVINELRDRGWQVVPQVGVSGYRIDMAVVNPYSPGRFLLGIECDGATYHSAPSARDRDRLRQMVLEGLGWEIYRIWSTDWWFDQSTPLQNLLSRLEELKEQAQISSERSQAELVQENNDHED